MSNNNNSYDKYNSHSLRPPYTLKQQSHSSAYNQYDAYYLSTINNGNSAYMPEPMSSYSNIQQESMNSQPILQEFNDEMVPSEPDEFIIDLLKKPQERLFLLKLELEFEEFIKDKERFRHGFPNMNSYQRLMIHKLAPYYKLNHFHDGPRKGVYVCKTVITEMPIVRLPNVDISEYNEEQSQTTPVPAPQFKIMRRSDGPESKASRSSGDGGSTKNSRKNMTFEERQTAYEEARARIFQHLEEKQ